MIFIQPGPLTGVKLAIPSEELLLVVSTKDIDPVGVGSVGDFAKPNAVAVKV
jgi:hypothetical protein